MAKPLEDILGKLPIKGATLVGGAGFSNYLPVLNADGQLNATLFASSVSRTHSVADSTERLALSSAEVGDIVVQLNTTIAYILIAADPTDEASWLMVGIGVLPTWAPAATNISEVVDKLWEISINSSNDSNTLLITNPGITFHTTAATPFAVHSDNATVVTNLNADLLDGIHATSFRNASLLSTGIIPADRLTGTYNINISGSVALAETAVNCETATTSEACTGNATTATTAAACSGNSVTATTANTAVELALGVLDPDHPTIKNGAYYLNAINITGTIPKAHFDAESHGAIAHTCSDGLTHPEATDTTSGFMSAAQFNKLEAIEANAQEQIAAFSTISILNSPPESFTATGDAYPYVLQIKSTNDQLSITRTSDLLGDPILTFGLNLDTIPHSGLGGLTVGDDHTQYLLREVDSTINACHLFNNPSGAPFTVGNQNATTNLVAYLNADRLDGQHGAYYLNASNLTEGVIANARLSGAITYGINISGTAGGCLPLSGGTITYTLSALNVMVRSLAGTGVRVPLIDLHGMLNNSIVATSGATPATLMYRDSTSITRIDAIALKSTDNKYYAVSLSTDGGVTTLLINQTEVDAPAELPEDFIV